MGMSVSYSFTNQMFRLGPPVNPNALAGSPVFAPDEALPRANSRARYEAHRTPLVVVKNRRQRSKWTNQWCSPRTRRYSALIAAAGHTFQGDGRCTESAEGGTCS